ncbi:hypothetical protein [Nonomuraea basaltis]|nr:hypothetical protein [Nonomuraea basaltis]
MCERRCAVAEKRRLAEHVRAMVAAWPPLTRRQRERLALLLRPRP